MGELQSKTILENTAYTLTFYVSSESLTQIKLLITHSFSNMFSMEEQLLFLGAAILRKH